jgi:hypothetical protein
MQIIESLFLILFAYSLLLLGGLGLSLRCLPRHLSGYVFYIAPAIGYVAFCFVTIFISGLTDYPVLHSNIWSLLGLGTLTTIELFKHRARIFSLLYEGRMVVFFLLAMLVIVFFPVLHQGLDLYVGTANPDFYQSLSFHESLIRFDASFWHDSEGLPLSGPFLEMFPSAFQARFGAVAFSVLLEQITGISSRASVMTAVVVFLLCLPSTMYFFCRTVLEFDVKASVTSAVLVAISAATNMSFIHTMVGQNSALATFPLAIGLIYLSLKVRTVPIVLLTTIILNGIFWIYVMALPYILVPFGLYLIVKLFSKNRSGLSQLITPICIFIVVTTATHCFVLGDSQEFIANLIDLLSVISHTNLYLEFLTEAVLIYGAGLTSYPISNSMIFHGMTANAYPVLLTLALLLVSVYFSSVVYWFKSVSRDAGLFVSSLIFVCVIVFVYHTLVSGYGYANFKMISWLQFIIIPFLAWFVFHSWSVIVSAKSRLRKLPSFLGLVFLAPIYLCTNLMADIDYGLKSYGRDRLHGSLINSYGIGGNTDFISLPKDIGSLVTMEGSVALGFGDAIENFWAAYYVNDVTANVSILTHEEIPLDDAHLPDVISRKYTDWSGQNHVDKQRYFADGVADFYLLPGPKNLNSEIIKHSVVGKSIWQNDTFALYKRDHIKDLFLTGRGFFRREYTDSVNLNWWWPEVFRWSAEGGEIYHLMPSQPGEGYRIQFSVIAGLGQSSGLRTIELWHNGIKFDEVSLSGAARFISGEYVPVKGINRLVLRVKEKSELIERNYGLWNRKVPQRTRPLNILFSDLKLISPNSTSNATFPLNLAMEPKTYLRKFETFDGFDVDGWIRNSAHVSFVPPERINRVELKILVPGNLNFTFPYNVVFELENESYVQTFPGPGEYVVSLNQELTEMKSHRLVILPQQALRILDGMNQREVLQSIRISSITVE